MSAEWLEEDVTVNAKDLLMLLNMVYGAGNTFVPDEVADRLFGALGEVRGSGKSTQLRAVVCEITAFPERRG